MINRLIDAAVHCSTCGALGVGNCDCQTLCRCGWWVRRGTQCGNPVHRAPPRDVGCPYCHAAIGQPCRQRSGVAQAWPHNKRQQAPAVKALYEVKA